MTSLSAYRAQWFGNVRGDLLSGLVVALALIPEAIAFSIAVLIAFVGGHHRHGRAQAIERKLRANDYST